MLCLKNKVSVLFLLLLLTGCGSMPDFNVFSGMRGPNYEPMTNEVAVLAAPAGDPNAAPLYCAAGLGTAHFQGGWADFAETSFILSPGQRMPIVLRAASGRETTSLMGYFDHDGQKILFCPQVNTPAGGRIACASLYALDDDLSMGIRRTFDVPDMVMSGQITCSYDKSHLKKLGAS
jgi:hypothetical protein